VTLAIATPHRLATEAGVEAFRDGGNAIDAAVAAAAVLTVVYPHNCAVGGDIIALLQTPHRDAIAVNGSGAAASAASAGELRTAYSKMPLTGAATVTVPGAVAAWETLLSLGGRRPLAQALQAAVAYADDGVAVSRSLAAAIHDLRQELDADEGLRAIFIAGGAPLGEGAPLCQPALARTLRAIAADGPAAVYDGDVGAALVRRLRSLGSKLTVDDLVAHETELAAPLAGRFDGLDVLTAPPNSQGFVLLEILAALEALGARLDVQGDDAGVLARLFALTAEDRDRRLADPRFADVRVEELLSDTHAEELGRAAVSRRPVRTSAAGAPAASGDTVAVVAADSEGYAVSLIQSVFSTFGARILDPATGILCHNRGASFSLDPASPNALVGGKRPAHTLMPVLLRDGARVVGVNGTMGGRAQAQIHTHLLLAARNGASPEEAVRAPRWTVGTLEGGGTLGVVAERDVSERALASIEAAGFALERVGVLDEEVGHAQSVRVDGSSFLAGSDPRADGSAVVL
jgi:gamma-glutamyltranspeptidase/glutathione hydrolase